MVVTAAGGGTAESGHGIEFRTLGLFQVEMRDAPTLQQLFFVMSPFVGHHRLVGLLEREHELSDILFQVQDGLVLGGREYRVNRGCGGVQSERDVGLSRPPDKAWWGNNE